MYTQTHFFVYIDNRNSEAIWVLISSTKNECYCLSLWVKIIICFCEGITRDDKATFIAKLKYVFFLFLECTNNLITIVPPDYDEVLGAHTSQGYRVIACAYIQLPTMDLEKAQQLSR
jgi:hypothetical protein